MQIYGLDFTSTPSRRKPITCAICVFERDCLAMNDLTKLIDFQQFEDLLCQSGPWLAGLDFPFGQPALLIQNLGWGDTWEDYVSCVANMDKQQFERAIEVYRQSRPKGDKHHLRMADKLAHSCSPMMLYGVPVGKMFYQVHRAC